MDTLSLGVSYVIPRRVLWFSCGKFQRTPGGTTPGESIDEEHDERPSN